MSVTSEILANGLVPVEIDRPVHDPHGEPLGMIDQVVVDLDQNRIAYATLHLNSSFETLAVPWPEVRRDRAGDFHLNIDQETLQAAPRPAPGSHDRADDDRWLRELYLYYGHLPYQGRTMR